MRVGAEGARDSVSAASASAAAWQVDGYLEGGELVALGMAQAASGTAACVEVAGRLGAAPACKGEGRCGEAADALPVLAELQAGRGGSRGMAVSCSSAEALLAESKRALAGARGERAPF